MRAQRLPALLPTAAYYPDAPACLGCSCDLPHEAHVTYTCECPTEGPDDRAVYLVRGRNGDIAYCDYCRCCAELARMDWTHETDACIGPILTWDPLDSSWCDDCADDHIQAEELALPVIH